MGREQELTDAVNNMMIMAKKNMGKDSLIIYNGLRTKKPKFISLGKDYVDHADGVMFEHFDQFVSASKECVLQDWKNMKWVADQGKITIVKAWPDHDFNFKNEKLMQNSPKLLAKMAREKITYTLACFLIGAQKYSYFSYSWGYNAKHGALINYPEYHKRLGPPKGDYKRVKKEDWIFTREFKYASVWVDLENRKASIKWR
jgi:hypothetical protein